MMAVASALSLLTNAVIAWDTQHMQRAPDTIEKPGNQHVLPEHLRSIAPPSLEGINLRGTLDFPIADCVHRLMPSLVGVWRHLRSARAERSSTAQPGRPADLIVETPRKQLRQSVEVVVIPEGCALRAFAMMVSGD